MPTKTVYVKDEKLWNTAKKLAGDEGLSAVIAEALRRFVESKRDAKEGLLRAQLEVSGTLQVDSDVGDVEDSTDHPMELLGKPFVRGPSMGEKVAFVGRRVARDDFSCALRGDIWPLVQLTVFRTKGRKLILAARVRVLGGTAIADAEEAAADYGRLPTRLPIFASAFDGFGEDEYTWYEVFESPRALADDPIFEKVEPQSKIAFLNGLAAGIGEDWATWIE